MLHSQAIDQYVRDYYAYEANQRMIHVWRQYQITWIRWAEARWINGRKRVGQEELYTIKQRIWTLSIEARALKDALHHSELELKRLGLDIPSMPKRPYGD